MQIGVLCSEASGELQRERELNRESTQVRMKRNRDEMNRKVNKNELSKRKMNEPEMKNKMSRNRIV